MSKRLFAFIIFYFFIHFHAFSQCENADFEKGDLSGWEAFYGNIDGAGNIHLPDKGVLAERHKIIALSDLDQNTLYDPIALSGRNNTGIEIRKVHPSGSHSIRLGNARTGRRAEAIRKTFTVEADKAFFMYHYAVVLEDPDHEEHEQPRFDIKVYNGKGDIVPCGNYSVIAGAEAANKGFVKIVTDVTTEDAFGQMRTRTNSTFWVKDWTTEVIDLRNHVGETITLEFTTTDCTKGGHAGYAYVDASCEAVDIRIDRYCPGDPSVTASISKGFLDYTWSNGAKELATTYNDPKPGDVISVEVTSVTGCSTTFERTLDPNPPAPTIDDIADKTLCPDENVLFEPTGENVGYYYWFVNGNDQDTIFSNNYVLTAKDDIKFKVTAVDSMGCKSVSDEFQVSVKKLEFDHTTTPSTCPGVNNGTVTFTPKGGTEPYLFRWEENKTGAETDTHWTDLSVGTHNFTMLDDNGNGCELTGSITIDKDYTLELTGNSNPARCESASGEAIVTATRTPMVDFTYEWTSVATSQVLVTSSANTLANLVAGQYKVKVIENTPEACWDTTTITVDKEKSNMKLAGKPTPAKCTSATGEAAVEVTDAGSIDLDYEWTNVSTSTIVLNSTTSVLPAATKIALPNVIAGQYKIKVTEDGPDACWDTITVTVDATDSNVSITKVNHINPPDCNKNNGEIEILADGGSGKYAYSLNTSAFQNNPVFTGLSEGKLEIVVRDSYGCEISHQDELRTKDPIIITTTSEKAKCTDDSGIIEVGATGGTPPYRYILSKEGAELINSPTITKFEKQRAGKYEVKVIDADQCFYTDSVALENLADTLKISVFQVTEPQCTPNDGEIWVSIEGGVEPYEVEWTNPAWANPVTDKVSLENIPNGKYFLTVTDAEKCHAKEDAELNGIVNPLTIDSISIMKPACWNDDGGAEVHLKGGNSINGYTYRWNLPNKTTKAIDGIKVATSGKTTLQVTVTDSNGCPAEASKVIEAPEKVNVSIDITKDAVCVGDLASFKAVGEGGTVNNKSKDYNYRLFLEGKDFMNQNDQEFSDFDPLDYEILAKDLNDCESYPTPVGLYVPIPVEITTLNERHPLCHPTDGSLEVEMSSGVGNPTFTWRTDPLFAPVEGSNLASITGLQEGKYTVSVVDEFNCPAQLEFTLKAIEFLEITGFDVEKPRCWDKTGKATVNIKGGTAPISFSWDHDPANETNPTLEGISEGNFSVTVTDNNDCKANGYATIVPPEKINFTPDITHPKCAENTGKITMTAPQGGTGNLTYTIVPSLATMSSTATSFEDMASGDYIVSAKDENDCPSEEIPITLNVPVPVEITLVEQRHPLCIANEGRLEVEMSSGTGSPRFLWNTNATTPYIEMLSAGEYSVTVLDELDCPKTEKFTINDPGELLSAETISKDATCDQEDGEITINATGGTKPYIYKWNGNEVSEATIKDLAPDDYEIEVEDANGCKPLNEIPDVRIDRPENTLEVDYKVTNALENLSTGAIFLEISEGLPPYSVRWLPSGKSSTESLIGVPAADYNVEVKDSHECIQNLAITVGRVEMIDPTNTFTPNGDGKNDLWLIRRIEEFPKAEVTIFTRWGNQVYNTTNYSSKPWDGLTEDKALPIDTYYYVIDLKIRGVKPIAGYVDIVK